MRIMIKIREYLSKKTLNDKYFKGSKENNIFEPSRGGIGIRLKIAKRIFTKTIKLTGVKSAVETKPERIAKPKIKASNKFDAGPANATFASPHLWSVRL